MQLRCVNLTALGSQTAWLLQSRNEKVSEKQGLRAELDGGRTVENSVSDRELIAVMRQYFTAKAELESLKEQLESARQAAGAAIGVFYDPRQNLEHAIDLLRSHRLKGQMVALMQRAEAWWRAASAADQRDRSEADAEPEDWQSFEKRADVFFGS